MKSSKVFVLFVGIVLLPVNLALADGEEATVAGTELSPTATDSSVPPSPQEAGGTAPPQREKEVRGGVDPNDKPTGPYEEKTENGKCVRIYDTDQREAEEKAKKCIPDCYDLSSDISSCTDKCHSLLLDRHTYPCELSWGTIAGIIIGVIILLVVIAICLCCYLKKKRGRVAVAGRPFDNRGRPVAGGPTAPHANQPSTAPPAYANQSPAATSASTNQPPPAPNV